MQVYNPGSPVAHKHGCKCDPVANHDGAGEPFTNSSGGANRRAYISLICPMHSEFFDPERKDPYVLDRS